MKSISLILILLVPLICGAQESKRFRTKYKDTASRAFFERNPTIKHLIVSFNSRNSKSITVYFRQTQKQRESNMLQERDFYNFNFIGDTFFFLKEYGSWNFPEKEIRSFLTGKCMQDFNSEMIVNEDSVYLEINYWCPKKYKVRKDEMIFTKVEINGGYKGGPQQLQKRIQLALDQNYFPKNESPADSVLLIEVVVDSKDSCLKQVKLTAGQQSLFSKTVMEELKTACNWSPPFQGGRPVKALRRIFVSLNSKVVTVAYPEF